MRRAQHANGERIRACMRTPASPARVGCRPPAPHGLREPNLTSQPLTPSVVKWCSRECSCFAFAANLPSFVRRPAIHCTKAPKAATLLGGTTSKNQNAFRRLDARSLDRVKGVAIPFTFARSSPHPFAPDERRLSRPEKVVTGGYTALSWFAFRLPSMLRRRCFSPTSATDLRHEHPRFARFPGTRFSP